MILVLKLFEVYYLLCSGLIRAKVEHRFADIKTQMKGSTTKFIGLVRNNRLLLKPFSIFGYMSLRSYFNLKYKSNFNITKI